MVLMNAEDPSVSIFVLVNDDISFDRCGLSLNKILAETENPATRKKYKTNSITE